MDFPKLTKEDHALRRHLIWGKDGPKMAARDAFQFVQDKARDREQSKKRGK